MTEEKFFQIKEALASLIKNTIFEGKTYIVGGAIRDLLMNREIKDIDVVVNIQGGGLKLAQHLYNIGKLLREPVEYPQYSVSMFVLKEFPDVEIEAVQTRKEQYTDSGSRNPETAFGTIQEDCIRRDLTINAIYFNVSTNQFYDFTGGINDINSHKIRVTNEDPDTVFIDDPLRILRVIRFASRFGWEIEKTTFRAMKRNVNRLEIISIERINDEFSKIITCDNPKMALNMIKECGAMKYIIPELENLYECTQNEFHGFDTVWEHTVDFVQALQNNDLTLRLAALLHDIGKPQTRSVGKDGRIHFYGHEFAGAKIAKDALRRLRYDNNIIKEVAFYVEEHMKFFCFKTDCPNPKVVRRVQYECGTVERFANLMMLMQADRMSVPDKYKEPEFYISMMNYSAELMAKGEAMFGYKLPIDGNDIMQIKGIPGGHNVRVIKDALLEYAIKVNPKITRESAIKFIRGYNVKKSN
jgi:putative nucleotidyltransferase with HDIG domain